MRRCRWGVILLLLPLTWFGGAAALAQNGRTLHIGSPVAHSQLANPGPSLVDALVLDRLKNLQLHRDHKLTPEEMRLVQQLLGKSLRGNVKHDDVWEMLDAKQHDRAAGAAKSAALERRLDPTGAEKDEKKGSPDSKVWRDIADKVLGNEMIAKFKGNRAATPDGSVLSPKGPAAPPRGANAGEDRQEGKQLSRWVMSMAERMKDENGIWNKSPALQSALKDFGRLTAKAMTDRSANDWDDQSSSIKWQDLSRFLTPAKKAAGDATDLARAWSMPALGDVKMSAPNFSPVFQELPTGWGNGFGFNIRPGVLEGCVGGVLAVAIVMLLFAWRRRRRAREQSGWRLGPWPVNPARIRSPGELILAFEYLALRDCGREAHSWNHRAVADGLGKSDERRQEAADDLALLYERARYAPEAAPLGDNQIRDARHNLCFLAGVSRA